MPKPMYTAEHTLQAPDLALIALGQVGMRPKLEPDYSRQCYNGLTLSLSIEELRQNSNPRGRSQLINAWFTHFLLGF
jgi:hypothetical protein